MTNCVIKISPISHRNALQLMIKKHLVGNIAMLAIIQYINKLSMRKVLSKLLQEKYGHHIPSRDWREFKREIKYVDNLRELKSVQLFNINRFFNIEDEIFQPDCIASISYITSPTSEYDRSFKMMKYFDNLTTIRLEMEAIGYITSNSTRSLTCVEEETLDSLLGIVNNESLQNDTLRICMGIIQLIEKLC